MIKINLGSSSYLKQLMSWNGMRSYELLWAVGTYHYIYNIGEKHAVINLSQGTLAVTNPGWNVTIHPISY